MARWLGAILLMTDVNMFIDPSVLCHRMTAHKITMQHGVAVLHVSASEHSFVHVPPLGLEPRTCGLTYHFDFRRHSRVRGLDYPFTVACAVGVTRLVSTPSAVAAWLGIANSYE